MSTAFSSIGSPYFDVPDSKVTMLGSPPGGDKVVVYQVDFPSVSPIPDFTGESYNGEGGVYRGGVECQAIPRQRIGGAGVGNLFEGTLVDALVYSSSAFISTPIVPPNATVYNTSNVTIYDLRDPNVLTHVQTCPGSHPQFEMLTTAENYYSSSPKPSTKVFLTSFGFSGKLPAYVETDFGRVSSIVDFAPAQDMDKWFRVDPFSDKGNFIDCVASFSSRVKPSYTELFYDLATDSNSLIRLEKTGDNYTGSICNVTTVGGVVYRCLQLTGCSATTGAELREVDASTEFVVFSRRATSSPDTYDMVTNEDATFSRGAQVDPFSPLQVLDNTLPVATRRGTPFVADVDMPQASRKIRLYQSDIDQISSVNSRYLKDKWTQDTRKIVTIPLGYASPFVAKKDSTQISFPYIPHSPEGATRLDASRVASFAIHLNGTHDESTPSQYPRVVGDMGVGADTNASVWWQHPHEIPLSLMMTEVVDALKITPPQLDERVPPGGCSRWEFPGGNTAFEIVKTVNLATEVKHLVRSYTEAGFPWGGCYKMDSAGVITVAQRVQGVGYDASLKRVLCEEGFFFTSVMTRRGDLIQIEQSHRLYSSSLPEPPPPPFLLHQSHTGGGRRGVLGGVDEYYRHSPRGDSRGALLPR